MSTLSQNGYGPVSTSHYQPPPASTSHYQPPLPSTSRHYQVPSTSHHQRVPARTSYSQRAPATTSHYQHTPAYPKVDQSTLKDPKPTFTPSLPQTCSQIKKEFGWHPDETRRLSKYMIKTVSVSLIPTFAFTAYENTSAGIAKRTQFQLRTCLSDQ